MILEFFFYDNQFFEAEFVLSPAIQTLIEPLSYSEFFKNDFTNLINNCNAVIAIYDFEYEKNLIEKPGVKFIGTFSYKQ